jgi:hypothetical protein
MTALTVPVRPAEGASLRPLPWRRMAWVSWRHHRIALGGVAVFLGALASGAYSMNEGDVPTGALPSLLVVLR